jgi:hypothetical protein
MNKTKSLIFVLIFLNCGLFNLNDTELSEKCSDHYWQMSLIDEKKANSKFGIEIYRDLELAVEYYGLLEQKATLLSTLKQYCVGEDIVYTSNEYAFTLERHHMVEEISFHNIQVGRLQGAWLIPCLDLEANGVSCEGIPEAFAYREIRGIID